MYRRLGYNLIWSWSGHFVFVVAGFLIPRLMDQNLGTETLGVWDFAWSFMAYLRLIQLDVGSSVNRYVAKYRATEDIERINQAVSSVFALQLGMGLVILVATGIIVTIIPVFWASKLGPFVEDVSILMVILGFSSAFGLSLGAFSGVVTGSHRWDIYNSINSGCHIVAVIAMLICLKTGGGLVFLGLIRFFETFANSVLQIVAAYKVCPNLKIRFSNFRKSQAIEMLGFGGKGFLISISRTILYQTNNFLIMTFLGPVVLALYSRPLSLIQQARLISVKFAHLLTPIVSELHAIESENAVKNLVVKASFYGASIALPIVCYFVIMGGQVLEFWMGSNYNNSMLISILAIGHLFSIGNLPLQAMLMGINAHGIPAIMSCFASIISIILSYFLLNINSNINMVAISIASTLICLEGFFLVFYACSKFSVPKLNFIIEVWGKSFLHNLPFIACLLIFRFFFEPMRALLLGSIAGGFLLCIVYYIYVLPISLKERLSNSILSFLRIRGL